MAIKPKPVEVATDERCWITELLNEDDRLTDVSVARTRVEPGVTTQLHALTVLEWYVIESGTGRMRVGDRRTVRRRPRRRSRDTAGLCTTDYEHGPDRFVVFVRLCTEIHSSLLFLAGIALYLVDISQETCNVLPKPNKS